MSQVAEDAATETTDDDTDADFEAGFANTTPTPTETPAGDDKQSEQTKKPEQQAEQVVQQAVEYVQLTKAEADELRQLRATAERSFGTAFGKIGGIERQIKALTEGAQVDIDQVDIDTLRSDGFEPLARALEKVKSLRAIPVGGSDPDAIERAVQERIAPALQKVEMRLLSREHPDWKEIDADPAFAVFNQSQGPEFLQRLAQASVAYDSEVVGDAIAKFKAHRKAQADAQAKARTEAQKAGGGQPDPAAQRRARMAAAATPRASGAQPAPDPNDDFLSGFTYRQG